MSEDNIFFFFSAVYEFRISNQTLKDGSSQKGNKRGPAPGPAGLGLIWWSILHS